MHLNANFSIHILYIKSNVYVELSKGAEHNLVQYLNDQTKPNTHTRAYSLRCCINDVKIYITRFVVRNVNGPYLVEY